MKKLELLAPAGNMEKLKYAFLYGADAVYLGGKAFGLRAYSGNFSEEQMKEAIYLAHSDGKKVYVTVNIIPHNEDLVDLPTYIRSLYSIGVDAIIVADPGVLATAKSVAPELEVHISTQANTTNWAAAKFWKAQGVSRIVLAREVSLADTKEISERAEVEIESFIHGAMCISYSGRCLLSNYFSENRDSNRGQCIQACRYKYRVVEEKRPGQYFPVEEDERGTYIFNSKDLCLLPFIPQMVESGITSFKIEGRMKSVHYVATVTGVYRRALDTYLANPSQYCVDPSWYQELEKISHRPYTTGFSNGKPSNQDQVYTGSSNTQSHEFIGVVAGYDDVRKEVLIEQRNCFSSAERIELFSPNYEVIPVKIEEMYNIDCEPIERAPHPHMEVRIPLDSKLPKGTLVRREIVHE